MLAPRHRWLAFVAVTAAALACDSATAPVLIPASMQMAPADTTIGQGETFQLRTVVYDTAGSPIPVRPAYTWTDSTMISVSSAGVVRAIGDAGAVTITATLGILVQQARVQITDSLLGTRVPLAGQPYSAAISSTGVAYVSLGTANQLARADLPGQTFSPVVGTGNTPTEVAFNSTGTRAYVTNQYSSSVSVVNVATNTWIDTIPVTGRPFEILVAPGDSILYVANLDSVYGFRLATKAVVAQFAIPHVGNGMVVAHDTLLYVSTHNGGTVVEFNLRTRTVARTFAVGGVPQKLAVSADGNTLYIANEAGYVQFWNLIGGGQIGTNLLLPGSAGYGIARRASNGLLYVTTAYFGGGRIYIVDPVTRTLVRTIPVGGSTRRVVFNASGSIGFVPNENGWVDFLK